MLRPLSSRWFELVVLKADFAHAMECIAKTGAVQLEHRSAARRGPAADPVRIETAEQHFEEIRERYAGYWPDPVYVPLTGPDPAILRFEKALQSLDGWAASADETVQALRDVRAEIHMLNRLADLFQSAGQSRPHLGAFFATGPHLATTILLLPAAAELPEFAPELTVETAQGREGLYLMAIGPEAAIADLEAQANAAGWHRIRFPAWLPEGSDAALAEITTRLGHARQRRAQLEAELDAIGQQHGLARLLGDISQIRWLLDWAQDVSQTPRFDRITGWVLETRLSRLETELRDCGVAHVLAFTEPPEGATPPVILFNPAWARRFEIVTRMIGMPGRGEADPTAIVAIIAPLLFGFMFGDVGQGLVLLIAGLALRKRIPLLAIFIPGGVMAILFGLAFGSVFAREDILPPLWLHPLEDPLLLLYASVAAGALILLCGLLIRALQMAWQGAWREWFAHDVGVLLCYAGLLATPFAPLPGLAAAGLGALWVVAAAGLLHRPMASLGAAGELAETLMQLLVNTISFARAGAFALAHAGLSVAVVGLADASGPVLYWPVLALGNVFVLVLEGLVVSIQTTRLVLFEFFIRFLTGGGREFRPLAPPDRSANSFKEAT